MRIINRDIVGPYIFSSDGYLLLGKSRKGGVYQDAWIIPGGGVEDGETKLEAVIRETLEEVGIDISLFDIKPIEVVSTGRSEKALRDTGEKVIVEMKFHNFIVQTGKPAAEIQISCKDDIAEASWHPVSELSNLTMSPPMVASLKSLGYL